MSELFVVIEMTLFAVITVGIPVIETDVWKAYKTNLVVAVVVYPQNHHELLDVHFEISSELMFLLIFQIFPEMDYVIS
jgi:hypothetical protein